MGTRRNIEMVRVEIPADLKRDIERVASLRPGTSPGRLMEFILRSAIASDLVGLDQDIALKASSWWRRTNGQW